MTYTKVTFEWAKYQAFPDGSEKETIYEVTCGLTPEEKETPRTLNDGGHPGAPAECEILNVTHKGEEVEDWEKVFDKDMQDAIAEKAFETAADREEGAREDAAEAAAEARRERDLD